MTQPENIHPIFDKTLAREDKESLLKQRAKVVWMTGLSGSGKSTIATGLESMLHEKGFLTQTLDGDNVRTGINNNLGFSNEDRVENIRRIAEVSKLFLNSGLVCINCFVSPTIKMREYAKEIIGEKDFIEVYVNASLEVCEKRDVKGLYEKARNGEIKEFTGIDAPFEEPKIPSIEIDTANQKVEDSVKELLNQILSEIEY
ncbi:MAG: adenylyl-sulfate kinase [Flavobacteriales bacterium]